MPAGNKADLSFAIQATKGVAAVTAAHRIYLTGGGLRAIKQTGRLAETSGTRNQGGVYVQQVRAEGSPAAYVRPKMIGALLYGAMGSKAVVGAVDPYAHTFELAATQPWLTFWSMLGGALFERFADCKITSLTIASTAGNPLVVTAAVSGLGPASRTTAEAAATVEMTDTFMHFDGKGALKVENVAVTRIESFSLSLTTGVSLQQGDDVTPYDATEGGIAISIETVETITNFDLYNRMVYGSATPANNATPSKEILELGGAPAGLDFKFTRVAAAPGPARSLAFAGTRVQVEEITGIEINTDGSPIKQTVRYSLADPLAGGSALVATLLNGMATYAAT